MVKIRDLLHADRVFKLMEAGLSFKEAAKLDDESASFLIEAWEIAMDGDGGDGEVVLHIGGM